ncbi:ATP-grasp ribosomal peptide maturase [Streptomyces sp. NPDC037389]|uniref:ATP-grasp ribosomal peptide maturase n=1 Tax=Streptomyces sp. NPDC037389 TaxID=3155369 RepID=UPI0033D28568
MTVLVLTKALDPTADLVISELNDRRVPVCRLDPGDFPENLTVSARIGGSTREWTGSVRGQHRGLPLDQVRSVYYRRPSAFRLSPDLSDTDARWARAEALAGFRGLLASLDCPWVNHPDRNAAAGVGPVALATASRCGLTVPATLITNDPDEARSFIKDLPAQIAAYKGLGDADPGEIDGWPQALWTTQVTAADITDTVTLTAHWFQEWIPKAYEVRLTVVGDQLFGAKIHAGSKESRIDFRKDYDSLTYSPCTIPFGIAEGVRRLMAAFGLRYAAMDFLVNPDGRWFLVDLNPNGQWAFVPDLRPAITHALADLLEEPTP